MWASVTLSNNEIGVGHQENEALASLLAEECIELDLETIVAPTFSHNHHCATSSSAYDNRSSAAVLGVMQRKRRNESRCNDSGLD